MAASFPLHISSSSMVTVALCAWIVAIIIVLVRRPALPACARWLCGIGALILCLAAGGPTWQRPSPREVAVMVDLSPSTRTADFRDRARLETRVHSLLGKTPYRIFYFASGIAPVAPDGATLPDIPADKTVFTPPSGASAIVLFSDGRFDIPPAAPPTYVVIDPLLETPVDAAITSMDMRGGEAVINIANSGAPRRMTLTGTAGDSTITAASGTSVIARRLDPSASSISARLASGDAWPENDQLAARVPPAEHREKWWVGTSPPDATWRVFAPAQLPTDGSTYLGTSVIVLQNIAATDLSTLQQQRLAQYVRDLGGGLVILGGDHAFAAGAYPGSELDALSPLASTPPTPTTHWILLADGSGSMAEVVGGFSLWHQAADAIVKLIPHLPPDDLLSTGSFSDHLTWWSMGKTVRQTIGLPLPPANVGPHGPTNLEPVLLDEIAKAAETDLPKQLLLITDAEAEIRDPVALQLALRSKKIHLHLLAIGDGSAMPVLRNIVRSTGGTVVKQFNPQKWADAVQTLMREGAPKLLGSDPLAVTFLGDLASVGNRDAMPWNHTWLKESATLVAQGTEDGKPIAVGAKWNVGEGRVLAMAFDAGSVATALSNAVGQSPRDPRYRVSWENAARLRVTVDAIDGTEYLNGKKMTLELSQQAETVSTGQAHDMPQIAPGRYQLDLPAPRAATLASLRVEGRLVDRIAVAGRYAPEFDALGNDHDTMEQLARQTGGQIIAPRQTWPIDFRWPSRAMPVGSILAVIGAALIGAGLFWWKWVG